jgi:hypothetical protein
MISQRAAGVGLPKWYSEDTPIGYYLPTEIRIKGRIVVNKHGTPYGDFDRHPPFTVGFGLTDSVDAVAGPWWHVVSYDQGYVDAPWKVGDWNEDPQNYVPFEFTWSVDGRWSNASENTNGVVYIWTWPAMAPDAVPVWMVNYDPGLVWPHMGYVGPVIADFQVGLRYNTGPIPIVEPEHFCVPASDGSSIEMLHNEPPLWGWHNEAIVFDANGNFTLATTPARDYVSVFLDGEILSPHTDYDFVSGKTYQLSAQVRAGASLDYVQVSYLVLSTWLLFPPNVSRPVTTDVYQDGHRMPDVRGHL